MKNEKMEKNSLLVISPTQAVVGWIERVSRNIPLLYLILHSIFQELKAKFEQLALRYKKENLVFSHCVKVETYAMLLTNCGRKMEEQMTDAVERLIKMFGEETDREQKSLFRHILVDDCQDFNGNWPVLMEFLLADNSDSTQCFWCFYDCRQQAFMEKKSQTKGMLTNMEVKTFQLTKVFRSTELLHGFITQFADMPEEFKVCHKIRGVGVSLMTRVPKEQDIFETELSDSKAAANVIWDVIHYLQNGRAQKKLINKSGHTSIGDTSVPLEFITVLVRTVKWAKSLREEMTSVGGQEIKVVDANEAAASNQVIVDSIIRFRGLDSSIVIWYEPSLHCDNYNEGLFYSAVTRAIAALVIITGPKGKLKLLERKNAKQFVYKFDNQKKL